jgi:hypothetical protein
VKESNQETMESLRRPGTQAAASADDRKHKSRPAPSSSQPFSSLGSHLYRSSLARAILLEIRNLLSRIQEIRKTQIHRRGAAIDPLGQTQSALEDRKSAIDCCISDMRNLYAHRPHTTLIEAELFVEGWKAGIAWGRSNMRSGPGA